MKEKIKERKKQIIIFMVIMITIILFFSGFSMGKGINRKDINGKTEVAKPILQVENGSSIEINNTNKIGTYEFKVKNYNEQEEITQVDLEYYIEILNNLENTGITLKLFKNDQEIETKENKTEKFRISKNEKVEDNYKLEITYDENKNINMENIVEQLQIKVHSEQMQEVL